MASQLPEITTLYHEFTKNQVLTHKQLNELINYFDDQDRLTKVFLLGIGIACGYKLSKTSSSITITPGIGITSDGDLLLLKTDIHKKEEKLIVTNDIIYSHCRKYTDELAEYSEFRKLNINGQTVIMDMLELCDANDEDALQLSSIDNLNEKAALLYLESYDRKPELCDTLDCDNQGVKKINRLKVLLVSKEDAELIAKRDSVYSDFDILDTYFSLPSIAIKRVILNEVNTAKHTDLKRAYYNAINHDNVVSKLFTGISAIIADFSNILNLKITDDNTDTINSLEGLFNFSAYRTPNTIQYHYDFLKDLVDTYNEIKSLLLDLKTLCYPNIAAFPKHLLLGLISETEEQNPQLRHDFYKSSVINNGKHLKHCASLINRFINQIKEFSIVKADIKLTPSCQKTILGQRAIPYYYNVSDELLKLWNFKKTNNAEQNQNLSFHTQNLAPAPHIQEPLTYNIDNFNFFRIEGHQGKDYRDALEDIDTIKKKYGLSFDVKALAVNLDDETLDINDYECSFEDLKVLLKAWNAEQECILAQVSDFFSSFSTRVPGKNIRENELQLNQYDAINKLAKKTGTTPRTSFRPEVELRASTSKLYNPVYKVHTVVSKNLSLEKDTIGIEMQAAIAENRNGSANDIVASANERLINKVNSPEWQKEPEMKLFIVDKGVELMAYVEIITRKMPTDIALVDSDIVLEYKKALTALCQLVKKMKAYIQVVKISEELKAFMSMLINQLSSVCCSGKKLEVLLAEVNKRKEEILLSLQLSKFIEKHPGAEHKAGVQPGGTFVLVYMNKQRLQPIDFSKLKTQRLFDSVETMYRDIANIDKLSTAEKNLVLKRTNNLVSLRTNLISPISTSTISDLVRIDNIADNTVVADLSLPYMCCSDCTPINYIIAKPPASLRLEKNHYCLANDNEPVIFEKKPSDGIVKSDPEIEGLIIEEDQLIFNAEAFPEELIGKAIRFTVNEQLTDAEITVYKGIIIDFEAPESPTNEIKHTFIALGDIKSTTFLWDFGDGSSSTEQNPTHTYSLPVNDDNTVTVSLTVTAKNGICTNTAKHDIVFLEVDANINLETKSYCDKDKNEYPFIITPENAKVEITGSGVRLNSDGNYVFIPLQAGHGTHTFKVNDKSTTLIVKVQAAPLAGLDGRQIGNSLVLNNNSQNATKYVWTINGEDFARENKDPFIINLTPNSPSKWKVVLEASAGGVCLPHKTKAVIFNTKFIEKPNCFEETKADIIADHKLLTDIKPINGTVDEIRKLTLEIYGGTNGFNDGVIDDIDKFLSGDSNGRLNKLFRQLLRNTAETILEFSNREDVLPQLVKLFELQLRLFFNILGCQSTDAIEKHVDFIERILKEIIELLSLFQDREQIVFSDNMRNFIHTYQEKVTDIDILIEYVTEIIDRKLI